MNRQSPSLSFKKLAVRICRPGAILPMAAIFIVIMLAISAFAVDLAYIELVKTELQVASDSAARAGASALVQGKSDTQAVTAAIQTAGLNTVAGKNLVLKTSDIALGQTVQQSDGTFQFSAGLTPYSALQVSSNLTSTTTSGAVPLFFGAFVGKKNYTPTKVSVAAASACEVCLVLDRSHSMCWDTTGTIFSYPAPIGTNSTLGIQSTPTTGSRWRSLETAVQSFCTIAAAAKGSTRASVVTWASDIGTNTTEYQLTGQTSVGVTTDQGLTYDMTAVHTAVTNRSKNVMLGATNMSSGITAGISILTGTAARTSASKVMILMTDGQWNAGSDPTTTASTAKSKKITIHCICFLPNSDQTTCQKIASTTGGKFYYATDTASLTAAFEQIAYSLPVALTK